MADLSVDCSEYLKRRGKTQILAPAGTLPANANLFASEWLNAGGNGCSHVICTDDDNWTLFKTGAGEDVCDSPPRLYTSTDVLFRPGGRSLTKAFLPGDLGGEGDWGGIETIVEKNTFPSMGTHHYGMFRTYFSAAPDAFYWNTHLKCIIMGNTRQDVYFQFTNYYTFPGDVGPDHSHGRIQLWFSQEDLMYHSTNLQLTPGQWYDIEWHLNNSTGLFEARCDGTAVDWAWKDEPSVSLGTQLTRTVESSYNYFKWTTYNNESNDEAFQAALPCYQYMGGIYIGNLGWIRGT